MCGIAGLVSPQSPPDEDLLMRMIDTMVHRGPDGVGTFQDGVAGLAHRRLSIIDLATGDQPMFNEDRSLALVFNGEIYDHVEHRNSLQAKGHVFSTSSDSEVILHLFEEYGSSMVHKLNGMFAFAIYDVNRKSLFLARDRLGQKPLFYAHDRESFAFASGLSALTMLPWVDTEYDLDAISLYLEVSCIPAPMTIYNGVQKLPPGCMATFEGGKLSMEAYWQPRMEPDGSIPYDEAVEELRDLLQASVKRRLVSDVPLGLFLSGGMDSSVICAIAAHLLDEPPKTYSIGFADRRYDEREYAELVAKEIGCDHHFLEVDPSSWDGFQRMVPRFEEPFADSSILPTLLLSEFTRQQVTVALSGDAADELFGGYYRHRAYHLFRKAGVVPKVFRRLMSDAGLALLPAESEERTASGKLGRVLRALKSEGLETYVGLVSRLRPHVRNLIAGERFLNGQDALSLYSTLIPSDNPSVDDIMILDLKTYLPGDIL